MDCNMGNSRIYSADDMVLLPSTNILPSSQAIDDSLFQVRSSPYPTAYVIGKESYSASAQDVFRSATNPEFYVVVCSDRFGNTYLDQSFEGAKVARRINTLEAAMNDAMNLKEHAFHYKREALTGESAWDFVHRVSQPGQDACKWAKTIAPTQQNDSIAPSVTSVAPTKPEQGTTEAIESNPNSMSNLFGVSCNSAPVHSRNFADSVVAKPVQAVEHVTDGLIAMLRSKSPALYSMPGAALQEFSLASQVPIEAAARSETPVQSDFNILAALNREKQRLAQSSVAHTDPHIGWSGMLAPLSPNEMHTDPLPGMLESTMALFATKPTVNLPRRSRVASWIDSGYSSGTSSDSPTDSAPVSSSDSPVRLGPESVKEIQELKAVARARDEEIDRLKAKLDSFEISGPYIGEYGVTTKYHEDLVNNREETLEREMEEQLLAQKEAAEKRLSEITSVLNKRFERANKKNHKIEKENNALKKEKHDLEVQKSHLEHVQGANEQLKSEKVELEERNRELVSQCQRQLAENDAMRTQLANEFKGTQFRDCLQPNKCNCLHCLRTALSELYQLKEAELQRRTAELELQREISKDNVKTATESDRAVLKALGAQLLELETDYKRAYNDNTKLKVERDNLKEKTKALSSTLEETEENVEALSHDNREMRSFIANTFYNLTRAFTADELIEEMRKHIMQSSANVNELLSRLGSTETTLRRTSARYSATLDANLAFTDANHTLQLQRNATKELNAELENHVTGLELENAGLVALIPNPDSTPARHLREKKALEDRIKKLERDDLVRDSEFEQLYTHRDSWRKRERIALLEWHIRDLGWEPPRWEVEFAPLMEQSAKEPPPAEEEEEEEEETARLGAPPKPPKWKGKEKAV
ncbi:MAG: hypothetical protein Q9157_007858 [Trypethelium eluteriae]